MDWVLLISFFVWGGGGGGLGGFGVLKGFRGVLGGGFFGFWVLGIRCWG